MQALSSHRLSDIRIIIMCLLQLRSALPRELQPLTGMIWTVPVSCLHWIEVQPKGFASKEPACECSLFDGILIHLKGAYLTAFPESNVHEVVLLSEGFAVFFWHRFSGLIYCLYKLCLSGDGHLDSCQIVRSLVNVEVDIEFQAISVNDVVAITLHFVVEIILLVEQSGFFLKK